MNTVRRFTPTRPTSCIVHVREYEISYAHDAGPTSGCLTLLAIRFWCWGPSIILIHTCALREPLALASPAPLRFDSNTLWQRPCDHIVYACHACTARNPRLSHTQGQSGVHYARPGHAIRQTVGAHDSRRKVPALSCCA